MSQSSTSAEKGRKRDRFGRLLGICPRSPPPISADILTSDSAIAPAPKVARLLPRSEGSSELQLRERMPGLTTPEPLGYPRVGPNVVPCNPALPEPSPGLDTSPAAQARTVCDEGDEGNLWAQALGSLSEKDKNTLEPNGTASKLDIEELVEAVREKREICLKNQWEFEFRGRVVHLRYQADKIISWLAKFKEVGDIAIQKDPGHAALPWAGIRFLLLVGPPALFLVGC